MERICNEKLFFFVQKEYFIVKVLAFRSISTIAFEMELFTWSVVLFL